MGTSTDAQNRESPEQRVGRLVAQLRNHALWDSLLIFSPPLLVAIYLAIYLYRGAWIAPITLLLLSGAADRSGFACGGGSHPSFDPFGAFRCSTRGRKDEGERPLPHPGNDRRGPLACRLGGASTQARPRRSWSGSIFAVSFPIASNGPFTGRS